MLDAAEAKTLRTCSSAARGEGEPKAGKLEEVEEGSSIPLGSVESGVGYEDVGNPRRSKRRCVRGLELE